MERRGEGRNLYGDDPMTRFSLSMTQEWGKEGVLVKIHRSNDLTGKCSLHQSKSVWESGAGESAIQETEADMTL